MARPRQVTDEQILDATRSAVLSHGAHVSLEVIANELGISAPGLLKRYGSRQSLLIEALRPDETELARTFQLPLDARPFSRQLEDLIERLTRLFATTMPRIMALRECGVSHDILHEKIKIPFPKKALEHTTRWLQDARRAGLTDGTGTDAAAAAIVGAIMTRVITEHLAKTEPTPSAQKKHQNELAKLIARGLEAPRGNEKP